MFYRSGQDHGLLFFYQSQHTQLSALAITTNLFN